MRNSGRTATIGTNPRFVIATGTLLLTALLTSIPAAATNGARSAGRPSPAAADRGVPGQPAGCCHATGANVPKVGGDYGDQDYSSLAQITPRNVSHLAGAFFDHLEGGATTTAQESTPVEMGGTLYVQTGQGDIFSVNAVTGRVNWAYQPGLPGSFGANERGVAIAGGVVYSALGGEHVVALDQRTGRVIWLTQVGTPGQDVAANGSQTPWTLYFRGLVFTGTENGGGAGMRGHLYALNASNGTVAWNFATTAAPGTPGGLTWSGGSYALGGGDAWMAPAIDPQLGLMYLAVANPEPRTDGSARAGNNLYTNSLVALRWKTGQLAWYFQSVHHDLWDYDNTMSPVIATVSYGGRPRDTVIYGSKTGYLFYLDARTGQPLIPVREAPVPALPAQDTSATQPIPGGDALMPVCPTAGTATRAIPDFTSGCEFTPYLSRAVLVTPGSAGGANWALMSFDQKNGLVYVAASEIDSAYTDGEPYGQPTFWRPAGEFRGGLLDAVNPQTNKIVWQVPTTYGQSSGDGILTTASGLLFEGSPDGLLQARSVTDGQLLWGWQTGAGVATTPITYRVGGRQYVAVFAGGDSSPYDSAFGDNLWVFKIGGAVPEAAAPAPLPVRVPVNGVTVAGASVASTVVLGRTWDPTTSAPSPAEDLASETAMAPPIMTVAAGTTVTFINPSGNTHAHCAESFFDPASFKVGPLQPGRSASYRFLKPGAYFYNDCAGFPWNTGEIIVQPP
jgi:PQQ-dependent dehydrogenase (methanol/ethanol family)